MTEPFETIREQMRKELKTRGALDALGWLARYPQFRREITAFLDEYLESSDDPALEPGEQELYESVAKRVIAAQHRVVEAEWAERQLGRRIAAQMAAAKPPTGKLRTKMRAVIFAWTVGRLYEQDPLLDRVKMHKALYLLEAALRPRVFTTFKVSPEGVYDSTLKYRDAEPIGKQNQWIEVEEDLQRKPKVVRIRPGPKWGEVETDARRFIRDPALATDLLNLVAPFEGWDLAVWTTVLSAARRIIEGGEQVSIETVKTQIASHETWEKKLRQRLYSDKGIANAIARLERLHLIPADRIDYG